MQAAGSFIDFRVELAAGMQLGHDDFKRRLVLEFRVRIDRNAPAIVGDGDIPFSVKLDIDEGGVAGHRLVHGIVDGFGEQMVHRLLVGAANIHARPHPDGLKAFQNDDVGGGVALGGGLRSCGGSFEGCRDWRDRYSRRFRRGRLIANGTAEKVKGVISHGARSSSHCFDSTRTLPRIGKFCDWSSMNVRSRPNTTKRPANTGLSNYLRRITKHFNDLIAGILKLAAQDQANQ